MSQAMTELPQRTHFIELIPAELFNYIAQSTIARPPLGCHPRANWDILVVKVYDQHIPLCAVLAM